MSCVKVVGLNGIGELLTVGCIGEGEEGVRNLLVDLGNAFDFDGLWTVKLHNVLLEGAKRKTWLSTVSSHLG